ncbi:MAG: aspartate dehydrogenase [Rubellimicrobium sp.]|nr:aspartate dehydrogenase [Rubellimicrobium sp.]
MPVRGGERIVLVGWGAIGRRVAGLLALRDAPVRTLGIAVSDPARPREGLPEGARLIARPEELAALAPTLVVEVAGRDAVLPWGRAALAAGADFVPASTSALADAAALADLRRCAEAGGAQILIAPGALGGIDALAAAGRLALSRVEHRIVKPPAAWAGTGAERLCDLAALTGATAFNSGPADRVATEFPQNANVAVIVALAGAGMARTTITLVADPAARTNRHHLIAEGESGRIEVILENRPLAGNPKSSELTALSLVRLIENRQAPLAI